jgi:hypothetical protein
MNTRNEPNGFIEGIGSFGADLATLAVLQARLAASDLRDAARRARLRLLGLVTSLVICAAGMVAVILGVGLWLAARLGIEPGAGVLLSGVVVLAFAVTLGFLSVQALASGEPPFQRSHDELERNLAWIRTTLSQSGR